MLYFIAYYLNEIDKILIFNINEKKISNLTKYTVTFNNYGMYI